MHWGLELLSHLMPIAPHLSTISLEEVTLGKCNKYYSFQHNEYEERDREKVKKIHL